MTSSQHLRFAWGRSRRLVAACALAGMVAMLIFGQFGGSQYQSTSSIVVQDNVRAGSSGISPSTTDTANDAANAATLAGSPAFDAFLTAALHEHDLNAVENALTAQQSGTSNIVQFTATASTAARARRLATMASAVFPAYSNSVSLAPIAAAERAINASGATSAQVQASIDRLRILAGVSGNVTPLGSATQAVNTSPPLSRNLLEGLAAGLVVGLLIMALREGLDNRARVTREIEQELGLPVWGLLPRRRSNATHRLVGPEALRIATRVEESRRPGGATVIAVAGTASAESRTWVTATLAAALAQRGGKVGAVDDGSGGLIHLLRRDAPAQPNGRTPTPQDTNNSNPTPAHRLPDGTEGGDDAGTTAGRDPSSSTGAVAAAHAPGRRSSVPASPLAAEYRVLALPAWSTAAGLEQLRARFDWIIIDAPWPSGAPHPVQAFAAADAVVLVVTGTVTKEQLSAAVHGMDGWPRRADAVILAAAP